MNFKFKLGDDVKIVGGAFSGAGAFSDDVVGCVTKIVDMDEYDEYVPYYTDYGWFAENELEGVNPSTIDPQELANFISEWNTHLPPRNLFRVALEKKFNLPEPKKTKKTMTVTMTIDVSDRGGEFRELGDTYGAFTSLMHEWHEGLIGYLERVTDENISVEIKEEK